MTNQDIERKSKKSVTNVNPSVPASLNAPTPMMPLHTFNFKNSYLKHGKDSSLNANCDQQEQNSNIVIPLIKHKSTVSKGNKNLSSFEAKENYLNNLILQHKHINMEIYNYVKGHFAEYIKNQQTSRLFQYYFNQTHPDVTHLIFTEIYNDLNALLLDSYANYFCLKIFYFLNQNDRFLFLSKIAYNFATLSTNKISTYPIQCILQNLTNPSEQAIIIQGLLMNNNNNANANMNGLPSNQMSIGFNTNEVGGEEEVKIMDEYQNNMSSDFKEMNNALEHIALLNQQLNLDNNVKTMNNNLDLELSIKKNDRQHQEEIKAMDDKLYHNQ
jgi:hypothetical protein